MPATFNTVSGGQDIAKNRAKMLLNTFKAGNNVLLRLGRFYIIGCRVLL